MDNIITPPNIMFAIGIVTLLFSIWFKVRDPQDKIEKNQALDSLATEKDKLIAEKDLGTKATILAQKEMESKALLLDQAVKITNDQNEKKFIEMGTRIDKAFEVAQNHINTIETNVASLTLLVNGLNNNITKLSTIIDERIPAKR
jgi:hypothetical protein